MSVRNIPFASHEARWFFEGAVVQYSALKKWFETFAPIEMKGSFGPPVWTVRLGGKPDVYLLLPGADDMGIKWGDGRLEIKGREAELGQQTFGSGIEGICQRWVKWSYAGKAIEQRFGGLFRGGGPGGAVPAGRACQGRAAGSEEAG